MSEVALDGFAVGGHEGGARARVRDVRHRLATHSRINGSLTPHNPDPQLWTTGIPGDTTPCGTTRTVSSHSGRPTRGCIPRRLGSVYAKRMRSGATKGVRVRDVRHRLATHWASRVRPSICVVLINNFSVQTHVIGRYFDSTSV